MKVKMILPALTEAESPFWRPVKYSLFPPLGLATLAGYFSEDDEIDLQDQHVEKLNLEDNPDLVIIQVYITNAYRFYDFVSAQTEYLMNEMAKAKIVSDEKRAVLRTAMQKEDALERLKEEQLEEYRSAEILEADNIIDDIVTARYRK